IRRRLATSRPTGADHEEFDERAALCCAKKGGQGQGQARARQVGHSCGARARSRNGAAVCGPAFNDAPSYRAAEAPKRRRLVGRFSGKWGRGRQRSILSCWRDSGPTTSSSLASRASDPASTGDEKKGAAVAGGSKCETGRCQSPGRWFDAPINDRETLTRS